MNPKSNTKRPGLRGSAFGSELPRVPESNAKPEDHPPSSGNHPVAADVAAVDTSVASTNDSAPTHELTGVPTDRSGLNAAAAITEAVGVGSSDEPVGDAAAQGASIIAAPSNGTSTPKATPVDAPSSSAKPSEAHASADNTTATPPTAVVESFPQEVEMHVDQLEVWPWNPRHIIDRERLDELIQDISENKQQTPVDVIPNPQAGGKLQVIAGQRRLLAIREGGLNNGMIRVRVRHDLKTQEEIHAAALTTQYHTVELTDLDFAITYSQKANEAGVRVLSRMLAKNPGAISKLRQIGSLPEPIIEYMKTAPQRFTTDFAYEVARVTKKRDEVVGMAFAREIFDKNLTARKTVDRSQQLMQEGESPVPVRAKRNKWDTQSFTRFDGQMRTRESSGEVNLNVRNLEPERVVRLRAAVEQILREDTASPD